MDVVGHEFPRDGIDFLADLQATGSAPLIGTRMRSASKLRQSPVRDIVGVSPHSARVVQRDTEVIPERWAACTFQGIFMSEIGVFARQVGYLAESWNAVKYRYGNK